MQTPELPERTANVTGRVSCRYCDDTGYIVVNLRPTLGKKTDPDLMYEEVGPCPFCQQGHFEEFGDVDAQTKTRPVTPPWRLSEGFWKGRDPVDVQPRRLGDNRPLPLEENIRRIRELGAKLGVVFPLPDHQETPT